MWGLVLGLLGAGPPSSRRKRMDPELEELKRLYAPRPVFYSRPANSGIGQTAFGGMAFATASGPWEQQNGGMANALRPLTPEPDGVPGSHPLERILDGLEKSGPERIEKFL